MTSIKDYVSDLDRSQLNYLVEEAGKRIIDLKKEDQVKLWRVETKDWIFGWYLSYGEASEAFLTLTKELIGNEDEIYKLSLIPDYVNESEVDDMID